MATYTRELKEIIESGVNIFNFEYPIFDEAYRDTFEKKFIRHFYFREIGTQPLGRFLHLLETTLNEIMPYYNKMYSAQNLDLRILNNYDVTETFAQTENNSNLRKYSDTPQGATDLTDTAYLTDLTDDTQTNNQNWTRNMQGNIGVQTDADAVVNYIQALINVDLLIFKEMDNLFMGVY